jgi:hypothetical protein
MQTEYKHIHFVEGAGSQKHRPSYNCRNNRSKTLLGNVFYYQAWKRYVFEGSPGCIFDTSCLADIIEFMKQLPC